VDNTDKLFGDVMSRVHFLQIFWMMRVGTKESNRAIKRTKKVHRVIEYTEKQFEKYTLCPCCTNFVSKTVCLVALWGFKIP
jgi:hypothetical protein